MNKEKTKQSRDEKANVTAPKLTSNKRSGSPDNTQSIESVREELEKRLKIFREQSKEDGRNVLWWTEFNKAESRLEGFNLGVSLGEKKGKEDALKDFMTIVNKPKNKICKYCDNNLEDCKEWIMQGRKGCCPDCWHSVIDLDIVEKELKEKIGAKQ